MLTNLGSRLSPTVIRFIILVLPLALLASGGCGWRKRNIPSTGTAREGLETALTAWQNGQQVGRIETDSTPVQVVDSSWGKGQKLTGYEILEEVTREDGRRCFKVRLQLQKPPTTQEVQYLVVGKSPLWIYREEDYQRLQGWEGTK
ncbi:MAG TPA: hypothetical protein VH592_00495 [Gemmataceae bacterium]|jgi:hypothetical protein